MNGTPAGATNGAAWAVGSVGPAPAVATIVLAAEIRLYREGLSQALAGEPAIEVVASLQSLDELRGCVQTVRANVVVIDTGMTGWLPVAGSLTRAGLARVVALGVRGLPDEVIGLAEAGVAGYVTRDDPFERLVEIVLSVARGEMPCSPQVSWHLMQRIASLAAGSQTGSLTRLTERESEILCLIEKGMANKEIARSLAIRLPTVKNHVRSILDKLEVHSRGEAAAVARRA